MTANTKCLQAAQDVVSITIHMAIFSVSLSEINGAPPLKKKLQGGSVGNAERNTLPFNKLAQKRSF